MTNNNSDNDFDGTGRPPPVLPVESPAAGAPPSPAPPSIEQFMAVRNRVRSDDGTVRDLMLEYGASQPEDVRKRLETDADEFTRVWDTFANAPRAPRPEPAPQAPPQGARVPAWRREQMEREAKYKGPILGSWSTERASVMREPHTAERLAAELHNREVGAIKARIRESGGRDKDAEIELAKKLFPRGLGKPDWGPEYG